MKRSISAPALFAALIMVFSQSWAEKSDIDTRTKTSDRVEALVSAMTLEEKIDFIGGYENFHIRPVPRLGIPQINISDGPVGIRNFGPSTAYPATINLAASWDRKLAHKMGEALGMESRAKNVHLLLAPGMNIYRMPITGRNFEYLGEDPYLVGEMGKHYIIGLQSQGVMANAKHYAANNQEYDRNRVSSDIDERTLREIYLPHFKKAVQEAKVASVMTGYNPVNGIQMSQHERLNNHILRDEWGFEGFTISDWASTYDGVAAANGGLDLEMPSGQFMNRKNLLPAIKSGAVTEATIDDKIRHILTAYERFGYLDNANLADGYTLDAAYVRRTAIDLARGGMVLLKNTDRALPLKKAKVKRIAVIGPNGHPAVTGGGGSSGTQPLHQISLLDAVKAAVGPKVNVVHEEGVFSGAAFPQGLWDEFPFYVYDEGEKRPGAHAEFYRGIDLQGDIIHQQHYEHVKLENEELWHADDVPETQFSVRFTSYFTPSESGYYALGAKGDDGYRILLDNVEVANLWRNQGPTDGKADVFLNAGQEYKVVVEYYQDGGGALIYQGIKRIQMATPPAQIAGEAIAAAREADVVIMAVGFDARTEGESYDRTFELPYQQGQLIRDVAKVNNNVIVVLNAGGNVAMPWLPEVEALLMAWYPGGEGNVAAAEILFGDISPSGKLPASFEYALEDNPAFEHYFDPDGDLRVFYGEGLFMGYRYWDQAEQKPRFPFGYGLSYTTFNYSNAKADRTRYQPGDTVAVTVDIKNAGRVPGAEVVQLYVHDKQAAVKRPHKELKQFAKVHLQPGEQQTVTLTLDENAFTYYDVQSKSWVLEEGDFELLIGSSSQDVRARVPVTFAGSQASPH